MATQLPSPKWGRAPHFSAHFYCGQTAKCIKMLLGTKVRLSPGDFVLDGDPAPSPKRERSPQFRPTLLPPSGCMDRDVTWYQGRPRPRRLCVRWVRSSPPQKGYRAPSPQVLAHVYCGQTAGWIKMAFGIEVNLGPGLRLPIFGPFLLWPNGWMHQDVSWYGDRPQPRRPCGVRWGPSPLLKKGQSPLPNFWPIFIVAKRLDGSRWHLAWR